MGSVVSNLDLDEACEAISDCPSNVIHPSSPEHQSKPDPHPQIFRLTVDCCDEIFEYLSVRDLHSFGQTCKVFQQIAGDYFLRNYSAASKMCDKDGIYTHYSNYVGVQNLRTQTSGFNEFMTNVTYHKENVEKLCYLKTHAHEFKSLKRCQILEQTNMIADELRYLREIFPKVEVLCLNHSHLKCNYYENILKYCENVKRLVLYVAFELVLSGRDSWLQHKYPNLEYLEWVPMRSVNLLSTFLSNNPNVQNLTIVTRCIWRQKDDFLKSNIKLDLFSVRNVYGEKEPTLSALIDLLCQLQERGFYKRLGLYVYTVDEETSIKLLSLKGLERLCIWKFTECYSLPQLKHLKQFIILEDANPKDMDILAEHFEDLQRFLIKNATFDVILPFFRRSINLMKVKIYPKEGVIWDKDMLTKLNDARKQLFGARKVTIYVPDGLFLKLKWTAKYGVTDHQFVELKRYNTVWEWDH